MDQVLVHRAIYISKLKNTFIYQSVGDNSRIDEANQELFLFPLSCETPIN
jgi:hypothetical protein